MIRISKVTMTMRELDRLKCIQGLIDGQFKQHVVAARLGLTTRLFVGVESTFAYFEATHQYLKHCGKPLAFYSDKASVFRVNKQSAAAGKGHTQFGRALYELNIDGMCANTPAAKGRVERAHQTLQDRLVKELRLQRISTVDVVNEFMPTFIDDYNRRFGKLARDRHDAHRAVRKDEDLEAIFA
jgi:hypothetical protein